MTCRYLLLFAMTSLLAACSTPSTEMHEPTSKAEQFSAEHSITREIYVAPEKAPCVGIAPMQCLQIRLNEKQPWQLYYGHIEGFKFEPGTAYHLRIKEIDVPHPPADAANKRWVLEKVITQHSVSDRH